MLVTSDEEKTDLIDELIDRYGDPPKAVLGLIEVSLLRNKASHLGISEINQRNGVMYFYTEFLSAEQIAALQVPYKGRVTFNCVGKSYVSVKLPNKVRPFEMMKSVVDLLADAKGKQS